MEARGEQDGGQAGGQEGDAGQVTAQLLKERTGEFALDSILLLKLRGLGLTELGCLGDCTALEWLDLSGNALTHLAPLAGLRQLAVLNVSANRLVGLDPLASCDNLQSLNAAGNQLAGLGRLQCLAGLRRLERLRLRDPVARLTNPLCASPAYRGAVGDLLPGLKVIDGERVSGRGSDLYQLCRDLDSSLRRGGPGPGDAAPGVVQPWVEPGYWEVRAGRRGAISILDEACRQFRDALRECRELARTADETLARAERALTPRGDTPSSFVF
ncbi:leucine-rich repeat-containing protein 61 [Ornithorhynchus anatinus]|uniref:Leucine-rich repeat-containing protein 61 n=1 Tax=Ornithorhynchus anatinus TaxID=9258 RepID=A0A6I8P493_ORNAN|nr:leucine-rich repeat-containing protein 61 [Ornithorhynchus anatinus]XP_028933424.1 leucine-rich repeat-containing protein 61 [Ornithorhynchus anatinus]